MQPHTRLLERHHTTSLLRELRMGSFLPSYFHSSSSLRYGSCKSWNATVVTLSPSKRHVYQMLLFLLLARGRRLLWVSLDPFAVILHVSEDLFSKQLDCEGTSGCSLRILSSGGFTLRRPLAVLLRVGGASVACLLTQLGAVEVVALKKSVSGPRSVLPCPIMSLAWTSRGSTTAATAQDGGRLAALVSHRATTASPCRGWTFATSMLACSWLRGLWRHSFWFFSALGLGGWGANELWCFMLHCRRFLRVGSVCGHWKVTHLDVRLSPFAEAERNQLPDDHDGYPGEGETGDGDDGNTVLGGPALAGFDIPETHGFLDEKLSSEIFCIFLRFPMQPSGVLWGSKTGIVLSADFRIVGVGKKN